MPLETCIMRDGERLRIPWGGFHVAAMVLAATLESGKGPFSDCTVDGMLGEGFDRETPIAVSPRLVFDLMSYPAIWATPLNSGPVTLSQAWKFKDVTDGEIFELLPGDVLSAHRAFGGGNA